MRVQKWNCGWWKKWGHWVFFFKMGENNVGKVFIFVGTPESLSQLSNFGLGQNLTVCEFKPHIQLSAVSTEPASCLYPPRPSPACTGSLSKINKH